MKHQSSLQHNFSSSGAKGGEKSAHGHPKATPRTPNFRFKTDHSLRSQGRDPELFRMLAKLYYL